MHSATGQEGEVHIYTPVCLNIMVSSVLVFCITLPLADGVTVRVFVCIYICYRSGQQSAKITTKKQLKGQTCITCATTARMQDMRECALTYEAR